MPSDVSGAWVFPWPKWMEMGDAPGHMFAAWSGYKRCGIDEVPVEFRQLAERDYAQVPEVDRTPFSKPIEGLHPG